MPNNDALIENLMKTIQQQSNITKLPPYKEDIESINYSLSCFSSVPCIAWKNILFLTKKYRKELQILQDYYPYTRIWIVPDVLITSALILINLNRLLFLLPRCMMLREFAFNKDIVAVHLCHTT